MLRSKAFLKCSSLTQVAFTIPPSVTSIESNDFSECLSLAKVLFTILSPATLIEDYAFMKCSLLVQITQAEGHVYYQGSIQNQGSCTQTGGTCGLGPK